ncbi:MULTISPECIES: hypothetical protein [Methylomicrobium]|uniref:Uncharacterized protein n=1 Tax=Methylomicrobium album BG8 TaxID=686340 RepID=H8GJS3_METAL|nr:MULTISPECIES: hypothetical protein [Methylomicrobium]EIC31602.1 hypothetical protein Metal_3976 [Methylomicrobium album BG8]
MNIFDLLGNIKLRPGLYLGGRSIVKLRNFLDGYYYALLVNGINDDEAFWNKFQLFISNKYHIETSQGWDKIILFFSNDEEDAFEKFFDLFEVFCEKDLDKKSNNN